MNTSGAQRTVIGSLIVTGGLVAARSLTHVPPSLPSVRVGLGLGVAGVCLSFISQGAPQLGGSLALLFLIASIFTVGGDVFRNLKGALS